MSTTAYEKIGDKWYKKNSEEARKRMAVEKEYFEILKKSIPFMKRYKKSRSKSVGNDRVCIDSADLIEILRDDYVLPEDKVAYYDEGYERGRRDGKKVGIVMAHRKASMKTKRALVLAAVALIAGSVAMGAANISNRIELNELYSYEAVQAGVEAEREHIYTVNRQGDWDYHYDEIAEDIEEDFELGLFGTYIGCMGWDDASRIECMNILIGYGYRDGSFAYPSLEAYFEANGWYDKDGNLDFELWKECIQGKIRVAINSEENTNSLGR
ncbi:MAG: hypothetical protein IJ475_01900 [Bacilli bacterium]|nr:hypothetical protein [Bacilli bacterium]